MLLTTLFLKFFPGEKAILVERIFENERNQHYLIVAIQFSVTPKGFNNMQFKSSTRKKF